jgi:hypothetical protein
MPDAAKEITTATIKPEKSKEITTDTTLPDATKEITTVTPKNFIEFNYPFIGGPLIEQQATNGLCYSQEKYVLVANQVLEMQKEKANPKKSWNNVTLEDYNRLGPELFFE